MMPGFIEGHGHFSGLGNSLMKLNFIHSKNWEEIVEKVNIKIKESEKDDWVVGRGRHQEKWNELPHNHHHGYPNHYELIDIS